MKTIISPKKSFRFRMEVALSEFYSRSIYKRMVNDVVSQLKNNQGAKQSFENDNLVCDNRPFISEKNSKYRATFNTPKKVEVIKDKDDDIPGMLYI